MGAVKRIAELSLCVQLVGITPSSAAAVAPHVCALLQDLADLPAETRERAMHIATAVFERPGLTRVM